MTEQRWVYGLSGVMLVAAVVAIGCSETSGSDNSAPLDRESNPASAKYVFSDVDTAIRDFLEDYPALNGVTLTLVDERLLDLDRPIAEYLDWGDHQPGVTMRQTLSMMAGFPPLLLGRRARSTTEWAERLAFRAHPSRRHVRWH